MNLTFRERRPSRAVFAWIAVASLGSVAIASIAQHRFDVQPCPWCILQRILFILIGLTALCATLVPHPRQHLTDKVAAVAISLFGLAGVVTATYQNRVAAKSASCAQTLADKIINGIGLDHLWPDMFEPRATCAEAAVRILGVPFELWSAALFALLLWAAVVVLRHRG